MVFVMARMGGGIRTGVAPVVAGVAKSMGNFKYPFLTISNCYYSAPATDTAHATTTALTYLIGTATTLAPAHSTATTTAVATRLTYLTGTAPAPTSATATSTAVATATTLASATGLTDLIATVPAPTPATTTSTSTTATANEAATETKILLAIKKKKKFA
ncbi:integumentary mucin C.1-like [Rosa chinensis]|uniref:integumentary mucin C.1-like n=1 Tax=Rosa chinensis TaxID=74649 RepID=UPI000D08F560|nr:integumentary mucin C.1-like [Rosa chinensis]